MENKDKHQLVAQQLRNTILIATLKLHIEERVRIKAGALCSEI